MVRYGVSVNLTQVKRRRDFDTLALIPPRTGLAGGISRDAFARTPKYADDYQGDFAEFDTKRCESSVDACMELWAWQVFTHGIGSPTCASHAAISPNVFVKLTHSLVEIEISAMLCCVLSAKGLPPFLHTVLGFEEVDTTPTIDTLNQTPAAGGFVKQYRFFAERSHGVTLHDHLDKCHERGLPMHLEAILTQLCICLRCLQKYTGFVHNDLHTQNILIEQRTDGDRLVMHENGQTHVFGSGVPFVRICDVGQAAAVHPVDHNMRAAVYTGRIMQGIAGADLAKFVICLVKWAMHKATPECSWNDILGQKVVGDVRLALSHLTDCDTTNASIESYVMTTNDNIEYFAFDVGYSADALLRRGASAEGFRSSCPRPGCLFGNNIFFEREQDIFTCETALRRYRLSTHATSSLVMESCPVVAMKRIPEVQKTVDSIFEFIVPNLERKFVLKSRSGSSSDMALRRGSHGKPFILHLHGTDEFYRRRVARQLLVLFQRGVLLYLKLFVDENRSDVTRNVARHIANDEKTLTAPAGETVDERRILSQRRLLAVCIYATSGDYEPFFDGHTMYSMFRINSNESNRRAFVRMRTQATHTHDALRFGSEDGHDGLTVGALQLTHVDMYASLTKGDMILTLFKRSTQVMMYCIIS